MAKNISSLRPFVKWAGGKRQLLAEIKKYFSEDMANYTYYEPFVGGGAVLFELQPKKAIINDSNAQLMIAYNVIKDNVEGLIALLKNHEKNNDKNHYYEVRDSLSKNAESGALNNVEKAANLIYLNRTCFNGLYRVNSRGFFNVPYGRYKNPVICNDALLNQISIYLNSNDIIILNEDFESAISGANENAFIYFDPPYHSPDKANFTGYQADGFDEKAQERLRNVMMEMTKRGAKCLLSNADTEFIRELYNNDLFDIISVQAKTVINSDATGRGNVKEVLIRNWKE